mmetsp:Transcript_4893/g.662  ORF Transcript_4893/g.662 Transcript_4893/m.662 type:complete len:123 (-) Transcript_4893:22-390(-)
MFVFRGLNINGVLTKIDLTDNQFGEDEGVLITIKDMLHNNTTLKEMILKHNGFYEEGCKFILEAMQESEDEGMRKNETLIKLEFSEKAPSEIVSEIGKICLLNKKRKRKKGKRKGKGKKKKR